MKTPVEILVNYLNSRRHEYNLKELKSCDPLRSEQELITRRIAKRISKSESSRQFCFDGESVIL